MQLVFIPKAYKCLLPIFMKYLAIIQARCGSSRLPGKVLKDLAGKTVIERMVERVKRSKKLDEIVVATTIEKNNLPLIELCAKNKIRIFVGSENNVLDRYYQAAKLFLPEYVVRITADCPVIDFRYIDNLIDLMDNSIDYACTDNKSFPSGLDVEILSFKVLREIWQNSNLASECEHVTLYIKNHSEKYKIKKLKFNIENCANKRLTLDHPEDYELILKIYEHFALKGKQDSFVIEDILEFLRQNPELEKINSNIDRFEGLNKSLREDKLVTSQL